MVEQFKVVYTVKSIKTHLLLRERSKKFSSFIDAVKFARTVKLNQDPHCVLVGTPMVERI
jgi:hypothetical protein